MLEQNYVACLVPSLGVERIRLMLLHQLSAFAEDNVQIVIEVPKGSGNKFKFDPKTGFFQLHRSLPAGLLFPFDYGFIPSTVGEDGDPLDALILIDMPVFV